MALFTLISKSLRGISRLTLTTLLWGWKCYYPHFIDGEVTAHQLTDSEEFGRIRDWTTSPSVPVLSFNHRNLLPWVLMRLVKYREWNIMDIFDSWVFLGGFFLFVCFVVFPPPRMLGLLCTKYIENKVKIIFAVVLFSEIWIGILIQYTFFTSIFNKSSRDILDFHVAKV